METNLDKFNNNSNNSEEKFTSLFLVDEINKFREAEGNRAVLTHDNFLKKIEKEFKEEIRDQNILVSEYKDKKGEKRKMYELPESLFNEMLRREKHSYRLAYTYREKIAINVIEQLLNKKLHKQYRVLNYKIDAYDIENNVAYEIDEVQHRNTVTKDLIREQEIKNELGCSFVRINI